MYFPIYTKKTARFARRNAQKNTFLAPHLSVSAGFGTLQRRLPWLHRAVPSATLDKDIKLTVSMITDFMYLSIEKSNFLPK